MRIFVTGATGVIGRRLVPQLRAAGHDLTCVVRSPEKRASLERPGVKPITVSLFDPTAVARAVAGHDAVINLATHVPRSSARMLLPWAWRENDRIRREASTILVQAAVAGGCQRFVQESFALTYPDGGDAWIDESTPI